MGRENRMKGRNERYSARRIALMALLLGLMLILGYVESLLPSFSVPGIKVGLSNSLLIFAVYMMDLPTAWVLMFLKVTLSGLLYGGVQSMIYSAAGGVLSMGVMTALSRLFPYFSPVVVSMAGAVFHNIGQVGLAMIILRTDRLVYYMAILILVGLACGALTGICAMQVMKRLQRTLFQEKKEE